ncbi:hypothetical protein TNCV_357281 [Trichonephila clavipes]|nr:hypothetical protein TNCV_357281 [Trichonephila clavipes]
MWGVRYAIDGSPAKCGDRKRVEWHKAALCEIVLISRFDVTKNPPSRGDDARQICRGSKSSHWHAKNFTSLLYVNPWSHGIRQCDSRAPAPLLNIILSKILTTHVIGKLGILHKTQVFVPSLPRYATELLERITCAVNNVDSIILTRAGDQPMARVPQCGTSEVEEWHAKTY